MSNKVLCVLFYCFVYILLDCIDFFCLLFIPAVYYVYLTLAQLVWSSHNVVGHVQ